MSLINFLLYSQAGADPGVFKKRGGGTILQIAMVHYINKNRKFTPKIRDCVNQDKDNLFGDILKLRIFVGQLGNQIALAADKPY